MPALATITCARDRPRHQVDRPGPHAASMVSGSRTPPPWFVHRHVTPTDITFHRLTTGVEPYPSHPARHRLTRLVTGATRGVVELEGIEPSSVERLPSALRPFPSSWLCGYHLTGSSGGARGHRSMPPELSPGSAVFPAASGLSRRRPPLLVPGCGGLASRAITGRSVSQRHLINQAARATSALVAFVLVPRLTSLSNSGRTFDFRSQRRNRSAPWWTLSWTMSLGHCRGQCPRR
jgi:hypothetical protein